LVTAFAGVFTPTVVNQEQQPGFDAAAQPQIAVQYRILYRLPNQANWLTALRRPFTKATGSLVDVLDVGIQGATAVAIVLEGKRETANGTLRVEHTNPGAGDSGKLGVVLASATSPLVTVGAAENYHAVTAVWQGAGYTNGRTVTLQNAYIPAGWRAEIDTLAKSVLLVNVADPSQTTPDFHHAGIPCTDGNHWFPVHVGSNNCGYAFTDQHGAGVVGTVSVKWKRRYVST
jgi:hypothetical protein